MGIADDFSHIASGLKRIEADKAQMLKGKADLSIIEAALVPQARDLDAAIKQTATWATYLTGDFDPA